MQYKPSRTQNNFQIFKMAKKTFVSSKTTGASKLTKPASSSLHHPPYFQMISEAISSLKDRGGSSHPAIAKCMEDKYKANLPPNFRKMLSVQLKKFVLSGKLVKIKNSYKISAPEKPAKKASLESKEKGKTKGVKRGVGKGGDEDKKGKKIKRLSQVSTPSALKKKKKALMSPKRLPKSIKSPKAAPKKRKV